MNLGGVFSTATTQRWNDTSLRINRMNVVNHERVNNVISVLKCNNVDEFFTEQRLSLRIG